jgi:uncharacterized protein (TIGR02145 family)
MDIDSKWLSAVTTVVDGLIEKPHRGICPKGWHIPTDEEWSALFKNVDVEAQQAVGNVQWTQATNELGFSALPAGSHRNIYYDDVGSNAYFWSASEYNARYAYFGDMYANYVGIHYTGHYDNGKSYGHSVRCIQD